VLRVNLAGEGFAIDRQGLAGGTRCRSGDRQNERSEAAHLLFQHAAGVGEQAGF